MRDFNIIHKVKKDETLLQVSNKYKIPPRLIINDNYLNEEIYEGQRLVISPILGTAYVVKPSDSLDDVANKFNIDKEKILKDNKISAIYPFMTLIIKTDSNNKSC